MSELKIIKMAGSHVKDLALLEKECFSTPWTEKGLSDELSNPNARFYVAAFDDAVGGYIGAHNVVGEVYITNVAVSNAFRRKGVAQSLVGHLLNVSELENADFVTLEVRESNLPARSLYEKMGFEVVGTRKDFYEQPRENAILMTKNLR